MYLLQNILFLELLEHRTTNLLKSCKTILINYGNAIVIKLTELFANIQIKDTIGY